MRISRLLYATALITTSTVLLASPAYALGTATINPGNVPTTAVQFGTGDQLDCSSPYPVLAGSDGWHFILPASTGDSFTSLTLTFSGGVVGPITSTNAAAPTTGPGWAGYFDDAAGNFRHAYVSTAPAGQTLTAGTATFTPATNPDGTFNLSHVCPLTSTSPSPSASVSTSPSASASASASVSASVSVPASTPTTVPPSGGAETGGGGSYGFSALGIGALTVASGAGIILFLKRRRDNVA